MTPTLSLGGCLVSEIFGWVKFERAFASSMPTERVMAQTAVTMSESGARRKQKANTESSSPMPPQNQKGKTVNAATESG